MAWSRPSSRSHRSASSAPAAVELVGLGHVDLEHVGLGGQLAGGPPGERQASPGAATARPRPPRSWAERATANASEASVSTPVTRMRLPSRSPMRATGYRRARRCRAVGRGAAVCKGRAMRIGILGGTGPAGPGLAVRLAAAGDEVVIGSRDAERVPPGWPPGSSRRGRDHDLAITGASNEEAASRRPGGRGHPVGRGCGHGHAAGRRTGRQGGGLDGQRPGQGGPGVPGPDAAPGLGGRLPPGRPARGRWSRPPSTTCRPRRWRS